MPLDDGLSKYCKNIFANELLILNKVSFLWKLALAMANDNLQAIIPLETIQQIKYTIQNKF